MKEGMSETHLTVCKKCKNQNLAYAMYCQNCGHLLHPHKKRIKRLFHWFTWFGALVIILFTPLIIYSVKQNNQAQQLDIVVSSPSTVKWQETFAYTISVTNTGAKATQVIGLTLDQTLMKNNDQIAFVLSADKTTPPPLTNRDGQDTFTIYYPKYDLAPGQTIVFSLGMLALQRGEYRGKISALVAFGAPSPAKEVTLNVTVP